MVIKKQVKEYSGRQRINLNKSDGFKSDYDIVLMSVTEYDEIMEQLMQLNDYKSKINAYEKGQSIMANEFKEMSSTAIDKLNETHEKQLSDKDNEINKLTDKIEHLKEICSNYNIQMNGLSLFDMIFRKKHKSLVDDFNSKIWIIKNNPEITEKKESSNKLMNDVENGN
ncbi:MAG: hypothetical protein J6M91_05530 [Methanobrevibacter sp.]|nr:hypothetical protein [Methanobrevibacter sp.]